MNAKCPSQAGIKVKIAAEEIDYGFFREICPEYNRDLLDGIKPTVQIMLLSGIILGLILDLACYKYRRLSKLILYLEGAYFLLYTLIPSPLML